MKNSKNIQLSVITATYNAEKYLPDLIKSLREQTCKDFEWVVADGASTDRTLELLSEIKDLNLVVSSQPDFGIYDALNRAIKLASGRYYVVIGADDQFYSKTIESILKDIDRHPQLDVLVGQVESNGKLIKIQYGKKYLYGARAFVASHSVGCVFRKSLHHQFGFYSNKYPIFADNYFIKTLFANEQLNYKYSSEIYGNFANTGTSSSYLLRTQCEFAHIQLTTEKNKYLQLIIVMLRIARALARNDK
jgi:glycosyltransferase involved in cell wall biosynthesis